MIDFLTVILMVFNDSFPFFVAFLFLREEHLKLHTGLLVGRESISSSQTKTMEGPLFSLEWLTTKMNLSLC